MDATPFLPEGVHPTLPQIHQAAQSCKGCPLYANATQAVTAERGDHSLSLARTGTPLLFVGEQPGDQEDQQGHPFVGPAGQLLNKALEAAGIDRSKAAITNAVKHFKWTPSPTGKRRLHAKPTAAEARACRPWLETELSVIKPRVVVCLGATAAQSLLGPAFRITKSRGKPVTGTEWAETVLATYHPSAILRAPDHDSREHQFNELVADLRVAAEAATLSK
jgi:uracil-DNA glycosylase family protein